MEAELGEKNMEELKQLATELQPKVMELSKKIQSMPEEERGEFVDSLGQEEMKPMMQFQVVRQLMQQKQQQEQMMQQMMGQMQQQQQQGPPPGPEAMDLSKEDEEKDKAKE